MCTEGVKLRQRQPGFSILSRRLLRFRIRNRKEETCWSEYDKRKLRQRPPGFSILSRRLLRFRIRSRKREEKYKLNFSDKIWSEYSDIRIPKQLALSRAGVKEVIKSGIVMDRTGD